MKPKQKARSRSRSRVHWGQRSAEPFSRLGSIAMFWNPTRINMSYKLNAKICHRGMKSCPRTIQGTKYTLGKRSSAFFFLEPQPWFLKALFTKPCSLGCIPTILSDETLPHSVMIWMKMALIVSLGVALFEQIRRLGLLGGSVSWGVRTLGHGEGSWEGSRDRERQRKRESRGVEAGHKHMGGGMGKRGGAGARG